MRNILVKDGNRYYEAEIGDITQIDKKDKIMIGMMVNGTLKPYRNEGYMTLQAYLHFTRKSENPKDDAENILKKLKYEQVMVLILEEEFKRKIPTNWGKQSKSDNGTQKKRKYTQRNLRQSQTVDIDPTKFRDYRSLSEEEKILNDQGMAHKIDGLLSPKIK